MFSSVHVTTIGVDSKLLLPDLSALVKSGQDGVAFSTPKRSGSIWPTAARVSGVPREIVPTLAKRSEEHTSELQSLMRISYAVFCLKKKTKTTRTPKI